VPLWAFLRIALVADIGPQLIAFDPLNAKPDHHAAVQFCAATPDAKRKARDRLAIGISQTRNGALADAFPHKDVRLLTGKPVAAN
jgi:hypothetical protein